MKLLKWIEDVTRNLLNRREDQRILEQRLEQVSRPSFVDHSDYQPVRNTEFRGTHKRLG